MKGIKTLLVLTSLLLISCSSEQAQPEPKQNIISLFCQEDYSELGYYIVLEPDKDFAQIVGNEKNVNYKINKSPDFYDLTLFDETGILIDRKTLRWGIPTKGGQCRVLDYVPSGYTGKPENKI